MSGTRRFVAACASMAFASLACACVGDDSAARATDAASDAARDASIEDGGSHGGADGGASAEAGALIDRMGRPAINTALVTKPLKDDYNHEDTYASPFSPSYQASFESHLEAFDTLALDGTTADAVDWPLAGGVHPLRDALMLDVLVVDTSKPCSAGASFSKSYLALESELLLGGAAHTTCGGRTPSDDVVDTTLTLLVTHGRVVVSDGVSAPTKPATMTFPYLAEPN